MSPEQIVAVLTAVAAVLTALGILIHQVTEMRKDLNGRLSQLLAVTREQSRMQGELLGRDFREANPRAGDQPI